MNGAGILTYEDGRYFKGFFADGKKQGKGTMVWTDGRRYEGEWKSDEKDGQGVYMNE